MSKCHLTCLCGHKIDRELLGGGKLICPKCERVYKIVFNPKTDAYELAKVESE